MSTFVSKSERVNYKNCIDDTPTFIFESMLADNNRWADLGNQRICATPLVCPAQVWMSFLGMKHFSGGNSDLRFTPVSCGTCRKDRPW
ncbi:hypothetical protein DPMN_050060 [Dreissena polymorpha]|uniref:Uncharacterized protein n=1 Tax=Dreissena polymorpha TaxID=45954 RepID=A0A9D4CFE7_DREPO|nr:hypothetical protein DPMN_050060 [Dreissena polymorpha]